MSEVSFGLWLDGLTLPPGGSNTWFQDDVDQFSGRWFTAVPNGVSEIDGPFSRNDQLVQITRVFHILKGDIHSEDGSGGARTLQVNVEVQNLDNGNPLTFRIYKTEVK